MQDKEYLSAFRPIFCYSSLYSSIMSYTYFTSESVCAGHPDKICDQVSDAIVDAVLSQDHQGRVAVETLVTTNQVVLAGEVSGKATVDYETIARETIERLGYTKPEYHFDYQQAKLACFIHQQSGDIALGVDEGGAGDQGIMFGYACQETPELMPLPITLAHGLAAAVDTARQTQLPYLRPDGKTEVTVKYDQGKPVAVEHVVVAVPHDPDVEIESVKQDLFLQIVVPVLEKYHFSLTPNQFILNGTGRWEIGGPHSDTGVTGRKIIVDTYGGMGRHGGGCFSGKDPSKVDRSGAYACRFLAKNIVAAGLADWVEVKVAYVIGKANPIEKDVETFGTEKVSVDKIKGYADQLLDLSVPAILEKLSLSQSIYQKTAAYGHFGRNGFPWEETL